MGEPKGLCRKIIMRVIASLRKYNFMILDVFWLLMQYKNYNFL